MSANHRSKPAADERSRAPVPPLRQEGDHFRCGVGRGEHETGSIALPVDPGELVASLPRRWPPPWDRARHGRRRDDGRPSTDTARRAARPRSGRRSTSPAGRCVARVETRHHQGFRGEGVARGEGVVGEVGRAASPASPRSPTCCRSRRPGWRTRRDARTRPIASWYHRTSPVAANRVNSPTARPAWSSRKPGTEVRPSRHDLISVPSTTRLSMTKPAHAPG